MALFKIYTDNEGLYRFLLKASTRQIIFISSAFTSKFSCLKHLEVLKKTAINDSSYERLTSKCGRPYFNYKKLYTSQIIGVSELFLNKSFMDKQIIQIKQYALGAALDTSIYAV